MGAPLTSHEGMAVEASSMATWPKWVAGLAVLVGVGVQFLAFLSGSGQPSAGTALGPWWDATVLTALNATYLGLAVVLLTRRPRNAIPWLLLTLAALFIVGGLAGAQEGTLEEWFSWVFFPVFVSSFLAIFHLFPNGRPIEGPLRLLTLVTLIGSGIGVALALLGPEVPKAVDSMRSVALATGWLVGVISLLPILVTRFRRAEGDERQQLKWFIFSVALAVFTMMVLLDFGDWAFSVAAALPAFGIVVALLRYRLYDVDRIISRTASYALVTGMLVATYVMVVALVTTVMPHSTSVPVAVATLAAAGLARPVLRRIQAVVDRRFNRSRYDAQQTAEAFGSRLKQEMDIGEIGVDLVTVVRASLQPSTAVLWMVDGDRRPISRLAATPPTEVMTSAASNAESSIA